MKKRKKNPKQRCSRDDNASATFFDTISATIRTRLEALRDRLAGGTPEAIRTQSTSPAPPRHAATSKLEPAKPSTKTKPQSVTAHRLKKTPVADRKKLLSKKRLSQAADPVEREKTRQADEAFQYWELPAGAEVREKPPTSENVSKEERAAFDGLISSGSTVPENVEGEQLFALIGLDFGTSSTKVIVRFPYEPDEPTIAIPAPHHCRSTDHPYLWKTVLWMRGNGEFVAYPEPGASALHTLKIDLMRPDPNTPAIPGVGGQVSATRIESASAYLAFVIRYVKGWLATNRPMLFRGRRTIWFANVGLPAASYDDGTLIRRYRKAAAAALKLANSSAIASVESIRSLLRDTDVEDAALSVDCAERLGIAVFPETAAAATGFAKSTRSADGLYLMVDVGAMTLDVCAFLLRKNNNNSDKYPLLMADVRPLGVEAFYWFQKMGRTKDEFVQQSDRCLRSVVWTTKHRRDRNADCWQVDGALPVFMTGGGAVNELHRGIVGSLGPWLKKHTVNDIGIRPLTLPKPTKIDLSEPLDNFDRFAVAWGLTMEIGEIIPPSDIEDIPPLPKPDTDARFISKDQV